MMTSFFKPAPAKHLATVHSDGGKEGAQGNGGVEGGARGLGVGEDAKVDKGGDSEGAASGKSAKPAATMTKAAVATAETEEEAVEKETDSAQFPQPAVGAGRINGDDVAGWDKSTAKKGAGAEGGSDNGGDVAADVGKGKEAAVKTGCFPPSGGGLRQATLPFLLNPKHSS